MENKDVYDELSSIKNIMERSTRFISLNGLSGVMAGIYALIGAGAAYKLLYLSGIGVIVSGTWTEAYREMQYNKDIVLVQLIFIAIGVLILSVGTGIWLTIRKAHRNGQTVWNQSSRSLLKSGAVPLLVGGSFILILLVQGYYGVIASACLVFYGLALTAASQYTYGDVRWLGLSEIVLGLLALLFSGYGLILWALGFGVLHILYGSIMYFKYDRENNAE